MVQLIQKLLRYRSWFPLAAAAATLLLGLLPMASVPEYMLRVNVYQLTLGATLCFLIFPVILVSVWALDSRLQGFERFTNFLLVGGAAVQIVSLCMMLFAAGQTLDVRIGALGSDASVIPQRLGVGFILLLGLSIALLIGYGIVALNGNKSAATAATEVRQPNISAEPAISF